MFLERKPLALFRSDEVSHTFGSSRGRFAQGSNLARRIASAGLTLWLLVTLPCIPGPMQAQTPQDVSQQMLQKTVAFIDLAAPPELQMAAQALSNIARTELAGMSRYRLVDRNNMDAILKEQGFQLTGACSEVSCLVKAGEVLGVQKMVGGSLSQLGRKFVITLQLIDVETGQVERAQTEKYVGQIEDLDGIVATAMKKVTGNETGNNEKTELFISSEPAGARVFVDGVFRGNAPLSIEVADSSTVHRVEVTQEGFSRWQQDVSAIVGGTVMVDAKLGRTLEPVLGGAGTQRASVFTSAIPASQMVEFQASGLSPEDWVRYKSRLRSPGTAVAKSLVLPVWGHAYLGHSGRGVFYTLLYLAGMATSSFYLATTSDMTGPPAIVVSISALGYLVSIIDAGASASHINARARREFGVGKPADGKGSSTRK